MTITFETVIEKQQCFIFFTYTSHIVASENVVIVKNIDFDAHIPKKTKLKISLPEFGLGCFTPDMCLCQCLLKPHTTV